MCSIVYISDYGGDWPLTENELSILDANQESLVDLVDCSELLTSLYSAKVINGRQRETISSEPTNHRRNEVLLDILRRRSIDDYRQVIRCLHESKQSHVAEILDLKAEVGRFSTSHARIIYMYVRQSVRVCMHLCVLVGLCTILLMYIYSYVCMFVCMYICICNATAT